MKTCIAMCSNGPQKQVTVVLSPYHSHHFTAIRHLCSVVQAQPQSPKPAKLSPSHDQGFTRPRAWALILGSLRPQLQALVYI